MLMLRFFHWLVLYLGARPLAPVVATQTSPDPTPAQCFDVRPGTVDRSHFDVIVARENWLSHHLTSILGEIVLREVLGYNVTTQLNTGQYGLCFEEMVRGDNDVDFECWNPRATSSFLNYVLNVPEVHDGGIIGYGGRSGLFTFKSALQRNKFADYYKFYQNASAAISLGVLSFGSSQLPQVLGEDFPACDPQQTSWCGTGDLIGYWATPGCENDPQSCMEFIGFLPTWDSGYFEMITRNNGIEAIFGYYGSQMSSYVRSLVNTTRVPIFYWFEPDPLLSSLDVVRISFPDYSVGCEASWSYSPDASAVCDYADRQLWKPVSNRVREGAPEAFYFITKYVLLAEQLNMMMAATVDVGTSLDALFVVACDFLKANMNLLTTFAPDCIAKPPDPVQDGDLMFNPETLACEPAQVFYSALSTTCPESSVGSGLRSDRIVKLVRRPWASHDVISIITEVVLRDFLGFTVELVYNNKTTQIHAPQELADEYYDVDMEVWLPLNWELNAEKYSPLLDPLLQGVVRQIGFTGYSGRAGLFIQRSALQDGSMLDYYKAYQNVTELGLTGLRLHAESQLQATLGDSFPLCQSSPAGWCGDGELTGYWSPPQCLSSPGDCIEIIHPSPSIDAGYSEQLVKNFNFQAVVAYYGRSSARQVVLSQAALGQPSSLFHWFEPDTLPVAVDAVRISFPDYSFGCADGDTSTPDGTVACDFPTTNLLKLGRTSIKDTFAEAYYALERIAVGADAMNEMLADATKPLAGTVCSWMSSNQAVLEQWAPQCISSPTPPEEVRVGDTVFSPQDIQCLPMHCDPDAVLRYASAARTFFCDPCEDGLVPDISQKVCEQCPAGQEVNGSTGTCKECEPGRYKAPENRFCEPCAKGYFTNASGVSACEACGTDGFQDSTGSVACVPCETVVTGGSVTPLLGATSPALCVCREGSYLPANSSECRACPDGMLCEEGADARNIPFSAAIASTSADSTAGGEGSSHQLEALDRYPRVKEGYMTIPGAPFAVYRCITEDHCPGGPPGSCATLRETSTVACGICQEDAYPTDNRCAECSGQDLVPAVLATVIGLLLLLGSAMLSNRNVLMKSPLTLMGIVISGIVLTTLQTLSVLKQLGIDWPNPFSTIMRVLGVATFDLDILRVACYVGNDDLRSYIVRQCMAPAAMLVLLVVFTFRKYLCKKDMHVLNVSVNTAGTIVNVFFISIVLSCLSPLVCYDHPGSSGRSVVNTPAALCDFDGLHASLVVIGILSFVAVPTPFLALVCYGLVTYPRQVESSLNCQDFLAKFRFLFVRFQPSSYWFGVIVILRGLLLCLMPVMITTPAVQVVVMALIISIYIMVQQHALPWRVHLANTVDGSSGMVIMIILLCMAIMFDLSGKDAVAPVALVGFALCVLIPMLFMFLGVHRVHTNNKFSVFICHHKADAAAQARLLKMLLVAKTHKKVFIDSDDLVELDGLFDIVKSQVELLLVYLTRETLTRPWCVGEITTALTCHGEVATVQTPSWIQPTPEEVSTLHMFVDGSQLLQEQGISQDDIIKSLAKVVNESTPRITVLASTLGSQKFAEVANRVAAKVWDSRLGAVEGSPRGERNTSPMWRISSSQTQVSGHLGSLSSLGSPTPALIASSVTGQPRRSSQGNVVPGAVVVIADWLDDEAVAAASILVKKVETEIQSFATAGVINFADLEPAHLSSLLPYVGAGDARACLTLLTRSTLSQLEQLALVVIGVSSGTTMVPIILGGEFKFPTPVFFQHQLPQLWMSDAVNDVLHFEEASFHLKAFFNLIAVLFSTSASDQMLDSQSGQILARIPRSKASKKARASTTPRRSANGAMNGGRRNAPFSSDNQSQSDISSLPDIEEVEEKGRSASKDESEVVLYDFDSGTIQAETAKSTKCLPGEELQDLDSAAERNGHLDDPPLLPSELNDQLEALDVEVLEEELTGSPYERGVLEEELTDSPHERGGGRERKRDTL